MKNTLTLAAAVLTATCVVSAYAAAQQQQIDLQFTDTAMTQVNAVAVGAGIQMLTPTAIPVESNRVTVQVPTGTTITPSTKLTLVVELKDGDNQSAECLAPVGASIYKVDYDTNTHYIICE